MRSNLKRVDLPEYNGFVYVRPMGEEDRELLGLEWAAQCAPKNIGLAENLSPHRAYYLLVSRIVVMSALGHSGEPLFRPYDAIGWAKEPDEWEAWPLVRRIAGSALLTSGWVPRGKDPVYRFLKKFVLKYLPDQEAFQILLAANRYLPEEYRNTAVGALVEAHPAPIYHKRFMAIKGRINLDYLPEKKRCAALEAATVTFGVDGNRVVFNRAYRRAAERLMEIDLLPPARKRGEKYDPPAPIEFNDGYTAIPQDRKRRATSVDGDIGGWSYPSGQSKSRKPDWSKERTEFEKVEHLLLGNYTDLRNAIFSEYSVRSACTPMDRYLELRELEHRYYRLSAEDQLTVKALYENDLDTEATARELRIENSTLRKRLERIRKQENKPVSPYIKGTYNLKKISCHKTSSPHGY